MTDREQLGWPGDTEPPQRADNNSMTLGEARRRSRERAKQPIRTKGNTPLVRIFCERCQKLRREVSRADKPAPANDGSVMIDVPRCTCDLRTASPSRSPIVWLPWDALLHAFEEAERTGRAVSVSFHVTDDEAK